MTNTTAPDDTEAVRLWAVQAAPPDDPPAGLWADLIAALGELDDISKTATATVPTKDGGKYQYSYATLADVLSHARPVLARHGLALLTSVRGTERTVTVAARFVHRTGATLEAGSIDLAAGNSAQQLGSAITYARRYLALAALGLAAEDDDGAAASTATNGPPARQPNPPDPAAVALHRRLRDVAGTPTAGRLRNLADEHGYPLTVPAFTDHPHWAAIVAGVLDDAEQHPPRRPDQDGNETVAADVDDDTSARAPHDDTPAGVHDGSGEYSHDTSIDAGAEPSPGPDDDATGEQYATRAQQQAIATLCARVNVTDRLERLSLVSTIAGRDHDITSTAHLTRDEAHAVITELSRQADDTGGR